MDKIGFELPMTIDEYQSEIDKRAERCVSMMWSLGDNKLYATVNKDKKRIKAFYSGDRESIPQSHIFKGRISETAAGGIEITGKLGVPAAFFEMPLFLIVGAFIMLLRADDMVSVISNSITICACLLILLIMRYVWSKSKERDTELIELLKLPQAAE